MLEFLIAYATNFRGIFTMLAIFTGIILAFGSVALFIGVTQDEEDGVKFGKMAYKYGSVPFVLFSVLCTVPDVDDLWKVRIGMIKLTLASPDNVQKGADEIARIGKKLECRYLGCEEEKKK